MLRVVPSIGLPIAIGGVLGGVWAPSLGPCDGSLRRDLGVPAFLTLCGAGGVANGFLVCLVAFLSGFCGLFCL